MLHFYNCTIQMFGFGNHLIGTLITVILYSNHPTYCKCSIAVLVAYEERGENEQTIGEISPERSARREWVKREAAKEDRPILKWRYASDDRILHDLSPYGSRISKTGATTCLNNQCSPNTN